MRAKGALVMMQHDNERCDYFQKIKCMVTSFDHNQLLTVISEFFDEIIIGIYKPRFKILPVFLDHGFKHKPGE